MAYILFGIIIIFNLFVLILGIISYGFWCLIELLNFLFFTICYILIYTSNPGIIPKYLSNKDIEEMFPNNKYFRECNKCHIKIPDKAYHCNDCDVCIMELDHHCPWVGKCIGKKNIIFFNLFITSLVVNIFGSIILFVVFASGIIKK